MTFFNVIATPGLGIFKDELKQPEVYYGQAQLSVNANPLTGNLFIKDFTKSLHEHNFQIDIGYQYNSQSKTPWRLNQGRKISPVKGTLNQTNSSVIVEEEDGHESVYTYDPERKCYINLNEVGGYSTLICSTDGTWTWWNPSSNLKQIFNKNNLLETVTNSSGNTFTYGYDDQKRLTSISGQSGRTIKIKYGSESTCIYFEENGKETKVVEYKFDYLNRLTKTIIPVKDKEFYVINYAYLEESNLIRNISQSDQTEVNFKFDYDKLIYLKNGALPQVEEVENTYTGGYSYRNKEEDTSFYKIKYNPDDRIITDSLNNEEKLTFHEEQDSIYNQPLEKHTHNGITKTFYRDDQKRIKLIKFEDGTSEQFAFNSLGQYSEITTRSKQKVLFNHDLKTGLLLCKSQVVIDASGTSYLNTFFIYNAKKELVYTISPNGAVTAYTNDDHGNRTSQKKYNENLFDTSNLTKDSIVTPETMAAWCAAQNQQNIALTEWTHYPYGSIDTKIIYANITEDGKGIKDEFAAFFKYDWNISGSVLSEKQILNKDEWAINSTEYDGLERISKETDPLGEVNEHSYLENEHINSFKRRGLTISESWNEGGLITTNSKQAKECSDVDEITYDIVKRPCIIKKEGIGSEYIVYDKKDCIKYEIDRVNRVVETIRDTNNRPLHTKHYKKPIAIIEVKELIQGTWQPQISGDFCIETTFTDAEGKPLATIDGDNYLTRYFYDSVGNKTKTIKYANPLEISQENREKLSSIDLIPSIKESDDDRIHKYFYDNDKNKIGEQTPSGHLIAYIRKPHGELITTISTLGPVAEITEWDFKKVKDIPHKIEALKLDARGLTIASIQDAKDQNPAFKDDDLNIRKHIRDSAGRIIESSLGGEKTNYKWSLKNQLLEEIRSNGLKIAKTYALCGKEASITMTDTKANSTPRSHHMQYNGLEQKTHELKPRAAQKLATNTLVSLWKSDAVEQTRNKQGLKVNTIDELGNKTLYFYNEAEELRFIVNPEGGITEFTYDPIFLEQDSVRYYDNPLNDEEFESLEGGLLNVEDISLFAAKESEKDIVERCEYNNRGLIAKEIDGDQFKTLNKYDAFRNKVAITQDIDLDSEELCVSQTEFDKINRPLQKVTDVDGMEATESWNYVDEENKVEYTDIYGNTHTTITDNLRRLVKKINALGHETKYTWDELDRITSEIDAMLNATRYIYEGNGRKITENKPLTFTVTENNAFNEKESETNSDQEKTTATHDVDGQLSSETDEEGNGQRYLYNIAGWLETIIDALEKVTSFKHNKNGNIIGKIEDRKKETRETKYELNTHGDEIKRTDPCGRETKKIYNKRRLLTQTIIDPEVLALSTSNEYNGLHKVISEIKESKLYIKQLVTAIKVDNLGREQEKSIDPNNINLTISKEYDLTNNCIEITDCNGHISRLIRDGAGNLRFIIDPLGGVIGYEYNKNDKCTEETHYYNRINFDEIETFSLLQIKNAIQPSVHDKIISHAYDKNNRRIATLDEHNKLTKFRYNAKDKITNKYSFATPVDKADFMIKDPEPTPEDRQRAYFYDKRGKVRFKINEAGAVTEKSWNKKGALLEKRKFAKIITDYEKQPVREQLNHEDDRVTSHVYDGFSRVVFEIDGEGYITEYEYEKHDKPTKTWYYPDKINLPSTLSVAAIRALLPNKETIPYTEVKYDAAYRKQEAFDALHYKEVFNLDSLDNLREYIDKGGDSWRFDFDTANRPTEESTPPVDITSVSTSGQVIKSTSKQRIIKKTEYFGDTQRITEAYKTEEERSVDVYQNPLKLKSKVKQKNVPVYDKSKQPTRILNENHADKSGFGSARSSETSKTLETVTVYNAFKEPIVSIDEAGNPSFNIYEKGRLLFEVDQEGYVTGHKYNVFGDQIQLIRYATAINLELKNYIQTGIELSELLSALTVTSEDRTVTWTYNKISLPTSFALDKTPVYIPQESGEAKFGFYSHTIINVYNAFKDVIQYKELGDPFADHWNVLRIWFNKSGYKNAELNGGNYFTDFTTDRFGKQTDIVEYAKKLLKPVGDDTNLEEIFKNIDKDDINDRVFKNIFTVRSELSQSNQFNVLAADPDLDSKTLEDPTITKKMTISHEYEYTAKSLVSKETLPNKCIILRDYDARNLPILITQPPRTIETGIVTPVTTKRYNAFGQQSISTAHANPYDQGKYLTPSEDDQTNLMGYDNRGLLGVTKDANGAVFSQTHTETKQIGSKYAWVTGWGQNGTSKQRLHQTTFKQDKRGIETFNTQSIEGGASIDTAFINNAFGEKVAQGSGSGPNPYPFYSKFDNAGQVWNTNANGGVPTISLNDANKKLTANLTSRTIALSDLKTPEDLNKIIDLDYTLLQRQEIHRNVQGDTLKTTLPKFTTIKDDEPEPYSANVCLSTLYSDNRELTLSWPVSEVAGLDPVISIWPKGQKAKSTQTTPSISKSRHLIDVTNFPTDEYEFQIDFYYTDPQTNLRDRFPRYRTEGSEFIFTKIMEPTENLLWHQVDDQKIMLYGKIGDVSGIELEQNGISCGRVAIASTDNPNCYLIDLSNKPSGNYSFRLVRGFTLLQEQPLKIGVAGENGVRIDKVNIGFHQDINIYPSSKCVSVISTWTDLPLNLNNLHHELSAITAQDIQNEAKHNYANFKQTNTFNNANNGTDTINVFSQCASPYMNVSGHEAFTANICTNKLYTMDSNNQKWPVAEIRNVHALNNAEINTYVTINPGSIADSHSIDALCENDKNKALGKITKLSPWANNLFRCAASLVDPSKTYNLLSLETSKTDSTNFGEFTIHTGIVKNTPLLVREIALKNPRFSKVKVIYDKILVPPTYTKRIGVHFKWDLPEYLSEAEVQVKFQLDFNKYLLNQYFINQNTFTYQSGNSHHAPYNGHLIPASFYYGLVDPSFTDFSLNNMTVSVKVNNDWIPLLQSGTFSTDSSSRNVLYSSISKFPISGGAITGRSISYDEADISTFDDSYTLLFYPLPPDIDPNNFQLEYQDTTLQEPKWIPIKDAKFTGHAISASSNSIAPGEYKYQLKAYNTKGELIDLSAIATKSSDGWVQGTFKVSHGGIHTPVKQTKPATQVMTPTYTQVPDRWGNPLSSTTPASKSETNVHYNGRSKPIKKTQPSIKITDENGVEKTIAPNTFMVFDSMDNDIAFQDANGNSSYNQRDNDGTVLKTILADNDYRDFTLDIFGRTVKTRNAVGDECIKIYDHVNNIMERINVVKRKNTTPNPTIEHWKTSFRYNEIKGRLSTSQDKLLMQRYDSLHPSGNITNIYLDGTDKYQTHFDYERNGFLAFEQPPGPLFNKWDTDYFGNLLSHTDLSGTVTNFIRNKFMPIEVVRMYSTKNNHGQRLDFDGSTVPMPNQDIEKLYDEASQITTMIDKTLNRKTLNRYDNAKRIARQTFIGSDSHILQAIRTEWNDIGWVREIQDTLVNVKYTQDGVGNRRSILASIYTGEGLVPYGQQSWNTFTKANTIKINHGILSADKQIIITKGQGTELSYDEAFRRNIETTISSEGAELNKFLEYLDNDLLESIINEKGVLKTNSYDGLVPRLKYQRISNTFLENEYVRNNLLARSVYQDQDKNELIDTNFDLDIRGILNGQTARFHDGKDRKDYINVLSMQYTLHTTPKIASVVGNWSTDKDVPPSSVNTYNDPNGFPERIIGTDKLPRHIFNNSSGRIVLIIEGDKKEFCFTDSDGNLLGRFGCIPPQSLMFEISDVAFDCIFIPVSDNFPAPTRGQYRVQPGDTFASIAAQENIHSKFGNSIAEINGFNPEDIPPAGLCLEIPNTVDTNLFNREGQYPVYNPTPLLGSMYPNMKLPYRQVHQNRSHAVFWKILVEAMVSAAIIAFAPQLAGAFTNVLGKMLADALGFAITGAAASIVQQEMAIGFGDQKGLNWTAVGQSALLAMGTLGTAKYLGIDLIKSPSMKLLVERALDNVELTLASNGLSYITGQQRHFDWKILVASVSNALANAGVANMQINTQHFNSALATASSTIASIGIDNLLGKNVNIEVTIANTLGTFIGNQLAAQAKERFAEFKQNKAQQEFFHRIDTPQIKDSLEASQKQFIQSILQHPHQHGLSATTQATPESKYTTPVATVKKHKAQPIPMKKEPRQEHLLQERTREEIHINRHERWNKEQTEAQTNPKASKLGFWGMVDRAAHSKFNTTVIEIGDNVANTVADMINPVTQFKNAWYHADKSIKEFRSGHYVSSIVSTAETSLDVLNLMPFAGASIKGAKLGGALIIGSSTKIGTKLGLFKSKKVVEEYVEREFKPGMDLIHFEKHYKTVLERLGLEDYTLEQYVSDANYVIKNGQFAHELNAYVMIPFGPGEYAVAPFVGLDRATGKITTFHFKSLKELEKMAPSLGWIAKKNHEKLDIVGPNRHLGWKYPYTRSF